MVGMMSQPHIVLNAHLLSGEATYRSAGIHGYQYNLLSHLPEAAPDFSYTALVGSGQPPEVTGLQISRSRIMTDRPPVRIAWEQIIAPGVLRRLDASLIHGLAFANPLIWNGPSVVTIHDLSFIRYPDRLGAGRRRYLTALTRLSAHRATRVITVSQSVKDEVVALLGVQSEKIDVETGQIEILCRAPIRERSISEIHGDRLGQKADELHERSGDGQAPSRDGLARSALVLGRFAGCASRAGPRLLGCSRLFGRRVEIAEFLTQLPIRRELPLVDHLEFVV